MSRCGSGQPYRSLRQRAGMGQDDGNKHVIKFWSRCGRNGCPLSCCSAKFQTECRRAHRKALPWTKRADAARNESTRTAPSASHPRARGGRCGSLRRSAGWKARLSGRACAACGTADCGMLEEAFYYYIIALAAKDVITRRQGRPGLHVQVQAARDGGKIADTSADPPAWTALLTKPGKPPQIAASAQRGS